MSAPRPNALEPAAAAAIALWVIVGAGLVYGIWETAAKVVDLFN